MNIDSILVDLEIIGQINERDKLAVSTVLGSTKLFVNQDSYINSIYRRYNGYNRVDSIIYVEMLITRVETSTDKIIDGNFTDMSISLKNSIKNALSGMYNLKKTYTLDSEMIARLTISISKLEKVFEKLKEYNDTINDAGEVFHDINIDRETVYNINQNTILDKLNNN